MKRPMFLKTRPAIEQVRIKIILLIFYNILCNELTLNIKKLRSVKFLINIILSYYMLCKIKIIIIKG